MANLTDSEAPRLKPSSRRAMAAAYASVTATPTRAQRGAAIRAAYRGKFTQVQLAEALGVAQNTISRWSTGDVEPSLDDLLRLEDVCGLTRGHILRAAGYVHELGSAEDFIASDHRLDPVRRELLLSAYLTALHQSQASTARL
jgi:transcriptional regulator with XRE-family HTH domain